jgi:hypothetical protein
MKTRFSWTKALRKVRGQRGGEMQKGLIVLPASRALISLASRPQALRKTGIVDDGCSGEKAGADKLSAKAASATGNATTARADSDTARTRSTSSGRDDRAAAAQPRAEAAAAPAGLAFAAAWIAQELARGGASSVDDLIAAACAEGGAAAPPPALADAPAAGPAAAALALLADAARVHAAVAAAAAPAAVPPHDGWLSGAPKPACHARRVATADAIHQMRATRDGEIGACVQLPRLRGCVRAWGCVSCTALTGELAQR